MIRAIIADDSKFVCGLLRSYLQSTGEFTILGIASTGDEAVELVREMRPDVALLDLNMPGKDGIEALKEIMDFAPLPVVMISGTSRNAAQASLEALRLGAVDFIFKFNPDGSKDPEALRRDIVSRVRAASQRSASAERDVESRAPAISNQASLRLNRECGTGAQTRSGSLDRQGPAADLVVIGASTGGPLAIRSLLEHIPPEFPGALLIVQHLPAGFSDVMAAQLAQQFPFQFKVAERGDRFLAGHVLLAPGDAHVLIGPDGSVELNHAPEVEGHRPSVSLTMQSAARVFGNHCHAILLSGMGADGSEGLVAVHSMGGRTYVQSPETCVVRSMPQKAIETGAVKYIAPPETLARFLLAECASPDMEMVN